MTQQFDVYGKPLAGGQLFIIQAGTVSTPQDAFQDTGLAVKQPYPMTLDAAGRIPQFFLADGTVKIRLQDKSGVVQLAADSVLVIGPSAGGGGGGGSVDPTQLIQTGNMILRYGFGAITGYVRLNNLTIGSATSGATERANADTQALYLYLWGIDPTLAVTGGRGATALADWTANKQLALPDWRGYSVGAMEGMGNASSGRLTAAFFGSDPTVLGAVGGSQSRNLSIANIDPFTPTGVFHSGVISGGNAAIHVRNIGSTQSTDSNALSLGNSTGADAGNYNQAVTGNVTGAITINNLGGGAAHAIVGPRKLCTIYMKL